MGLVALVVVLAAMLLFSQLSSSASDSPKLMKLTGRVTITNPPAFGFQPDPGSANPNLGGAVINSQTQGTRFVKEGAHVELTIVSVPGYDQVLLRVSPAP